MSKKQEWSENEKLLVAGVAWAQCYNVNPSNPLAVAQHIGEIVEKLKNVSKWLDMLAADSLNQAKTCVNFSGLKEACEHDAKNYKATSDDIKKVLSAIYGIIRTIESKEGK